MNYYIPGYNWTTCEGESYKKQGFIVLLLKRYGIDMECIWNEEMELAIKAYKSTVDYRSCFFQWQGTHYAL